MQRQIPFNKGTFMILPVQPDVVPSETLPAIGLGTMRYETPEDCVQSIETALEMGYRHIDTAQKYENEREVGQGIAQSPVPREDIFLATKVAETNLAYDDVLETAQASLDRLGVEQIDAMYVHWPEITYDAESTLSAFNELLDAGVMRHVGLANFSPSLLNEALEILNQPPLTVQVEMHPLLPQEELRAYAREHGMYLVAYCPLLRGQAFEMPELKEIAVDAGIGVAQLSIAWLSSKENVVPIPKATGEVHLRENFDAAELNIEDEVLARVDDIDREYRVVDPPEKGPWNR